MNFHFRYTEKPKCATCRKELISWNPFMKDEDCPTCEREKIANKWQLYFEKIFKEVPIINRLQH